VVGKHLEAQAVEVIDRRSRASTQVPLSGIDAYIQTVVQAWQ
jgi:hypothetical protein